MKNVKTIVTCSGVAFGLTFFAPGNVLAHCDSLDGPVVKAAQRALETRNLSQVLIWVQADEEPEIRAAFEQTLIVRALSPQAKELADRITAKHFKPGDVSAGREYIKRYVEFIHYVERLYEAITTQAPGHVPEAATLDERH